MKYIIFLILILSHNIYSIDHKEKEFNMDISIKLKSLENIIDSLDNIPIYPIGTDIVLTGKIINNDNKAITIEDPKTSQKVVIYCKSEKDIETSFLLNHSIIDKTGEITSPPLYLITLKENESKKFNIHLDKQIIDQLFIPGRFEISLAYDNIYSKPLILFIKDPYE